jgi:type II secretory pathway pseudopilin PulG
MGKIAMMKTGMIRRKAFTLVEMMFVVVVMGFVGIVLIEAFTFMHRVGRSVQDKTDIHHMARMTFLTLSHDVRTASAIECDPGVPGLLTLQQPDAGSIVYKQDGRRILRQGDHTQIMAEDIDSFRVMSVGTNMQILRVIIESVQSGQGHANTHTVSLDIARRHGSAP